MTGLFAGRYELVRLIGRGSHGEVWEAREGAGGAPLAVKILRPDVDFSPARVQVETAALRQRLPGVVELYRDGIDDGRPYLVMELIQGERFPGRTLPCPWEALADVTAALLETLARVHAAFVVHRDLKPENVLVTTERQIKVLDFGLAFRFDAMAARLTQQIEILGTPAYMAPEQVKGHADERSDLYAVGVMLYEALSGQRPYEGSTLAELQRAKSRRPTPLSVAAPGVPAQVARIVEDLIAYDPDQRPRSAIEVLHRLHGEASVEAPHFPWIGPQDTLLDLVSAVSRGASVDLVGPHGAGRTRYLLALSQALGGARPPVYLPPGEHAFESLLPAIGSLDGLADATLAEVALAVESKLRAALASGVIILADDAERLDRWSRSALAACRGDGAIVMVWLSPPARRGPRDDVLTLLLPSPEERHLRSLFAGPDRLLHLREDAARVLHRRTDGMPARITQEVTTWVRLGVAHWTRNLLVVNRPAIEALESGLLDAMPIDPNPSATEHLTSAMIDVLIWLGLAWPHTTAALIAKASGEPLFRVEADLDALEEAGLVERNPDGRAVPRLSISAAQRWTEGRLRAAHQALARLLPEAAPGRLVHLWMRGTSSDDERRELAAEAAALGERLVDEGKLQPAMATLERGMRVVRELGASASIEIARLFGIWVEAAIAAGTPHALDRVLSEMSLQSPKSGAVLHLEALCHAANGVREFGQWPMKGIGEVERFGDPRTERVRLTVRMEAVRHLSDPRAEEALLDEIAAELPAGDAEAEALLDNFRGRLRYGQGRFLEAAELHRRAALKTARALLRTYSNATGAVACMDAFDFDEGRRLATISAADARELRHAFYETLSEWVLRTIAYRTGEVTRPDMELVEAAAFVGIPQLEGLILMNESTVAWRGGDHGAAKLLSGRAHKTLSAIHEDPAALISRSLHIRLGAETSDEEIERLCARAEGPLLPGIGLQAVALLAEAGHLPPGRMTEEQVTRLAEAVPRAHWSKRMDFMSVDECLAALR
ncbi:MAG: serine/threonine-protein kinase [Byssovorax sp.]